MVSPSADSPPLPFEFLALGAPPELGHHGRSFASCVPWPRSHAPRAPPRARSPHSLTAPRGPPCRRPAPTPAPSLGRCRCSSRSGAPAEPAPPSVRPCSVRRRNPRPSPGWRPASPAVVTNPPAPAICRLRPPLWCARKSGCWAPLRPRPFGRQPRGHAPENRKAPWGQ